MGILKSSVLLIIQKGSAAGAFFEAQQLWTLISHGSAATFLRCGGQCYEFFLANFIIFLAVKEFLRAVKF